MTAGRPAAEAGAGLTDEVAAFLADTPPFSALDPPTLHALASGVLLDFYPKGFRILAAGGPPSDSLRLIVSGGVKVSLDPGGDGEVLVDYRSAGDAVGYLSLLSGDISRAEVTAAEDTVCYLLPREPFLRLLAERPAVREYFHRIFLAKYLDRAFDDMRNRTLLLGGGERLLFTTPLGDVLSRAPVTAPLAITIREAAGLMSRQRVSSLVLLDDGGGPAGILTDSDLRAKVAARALDTGQPAAAVMTSALVTAEAGTPCFEALLTMIRHNIHHLVVTGHQGIAGIVTNHDLMLLQGTSPISIVRELEAQRDLDGLVQVAARVVDLVGLLIREGAKAVNLGRIIAEIDDRLVRRVTAVVAAACGPPPLPWCWLAHGRPGRRERTFRCPQSNALLWADAADPGEEAAMRAWAAGFGTRAADALARCGLPPSPEGRMASNPEWTGSLSAWRGRFAGWLRDPASGADPAVLGLLDFRPVTGEKAAAGALREEISRQLAAGAPLLEGAARAAAAHRPPLGFFGSYVVERGGALRRTLDLETAGIAPIVDIARVCALEAGAGETGTVERLRALGGRHPVTARHGEELQRAFEFLASLQVAHRVRRRHEGAAEDDLVEPEALGAHERRSLKDAFGVLARAQELIGERPARQR